MYNSVGMNIIVLSHKSKPINPKDIKYIYNKVDWWPQRTIEDIGKILNENCYAVWSDDKIIGFLRYVTDGEFRAYIEDMVILPDYQREGLGQLLLEESLKDFEDIDVISLFCEEELIPFYEKVGFKASKKQRVMHKK